MNTLPMSINSQDKQKKVIIFGNGVLAQIAYFYLTNDSSYKVSAFCIDKEFLKEDSFLNLPLVAFEGIEKKYPNDKYAFFAPLSYKKINKIRADKYYEIKKKGYDMISYVCSKAVTWKDLKIGDNCFILENNTIQPFAKIGNNVIIWSGNHIGHHSIIEDHCFISSHVVISGFAKIGAYSFLGVNSTIRDRISIAFNNVIGMGATIMKDTNKNEVYLDNPATLYHKKSSEIKL